MNMDGWFEDPGHLRPNDIAEGLERQYWNDFAEEVSGNVSGYQDEEFVEVRPEDVIEVLEKYDPGTPDSATEDAVRSRIKSRVLNPHIRDEKTPDYIDQIVTKQFPGLKGKYRLADQGLARTVFRGPVDSEKDKALYLPNEGLEPDIYDTDIRNRMVMVAVSMQNAERIEEFISDTFQPVIIEDNGRKIPAAFGEYRPLEDVPEDRKKEAASFARELQDRANSGEIITLYTLEEDTENEFVFGESHREENIRYDTEREKLVAADAGEINPNVSREEVEGLLDQEYIDLIESF